MSLSGHAHWTTLERDRFFSAFGLFLRACTVFSDSACLFIQNTERVGHGVPSLGHSCRTLHRARQSHPAPAWQEALLTVAHAHRIVRREKAFHTNSFRCSSTAPPCGRDVIAVSFSTTTFGWLCCSLRRRSSMAAVTSAAMTRRPPMTMPAIAPPDSSSSFPTTADDSSGSGVETDRCCGGEGGAAGGSDERVNVGGSTTSTPRTAVASSAVASFVSSLAAKAMAVVARSSLATAGGVMST